MKFITLPLALGATACLGLARYAPYFVGSELFNGHSMYMIHGLLTHRTGLDDLAKCWDVSWGGNLIGAVLLSVCFVYGGGAILGVEGKSLIHSFAQKKMHGTPTTLFLNGLLCNGLVCLAIWTAARKSSDMAKIAIIWFCLYAVIAAGFEHPIANMTVFSVALLSDLPTTITLGGTAWSLFFIGIDLAKQSFQLLGALPDGSGGFCKRLSRPQLLAFLADIPDRSVAL